MASCRDQARQRPPANSPGTGGTGRELSTSLPVSTADRAEPASSPAAGPRILPFCGIRRCAMRRSKGGPNHDCISRRVSGRIFISYRRGETTFPAGWIFDRLATHSGKDQVFKDVDSIKPGDDFVEVIAEALSRRSAWPGGSDAPF